VVTLGSEVNYVRSYLVTSRSITRDNKIADCSQGKSLTRDVMDYFSLVRREQSIHYNMDASLKMISKDQFIFLFYENAIGEHKHVVI
jgi:hypothetical protein